MQATLDRCISRDSRVLAIAMPALFLGCRSADPTVAWFNANRKHLDTVRDMLVVDKGSVTSVQLGTLGELHDVAGAKGSCGPDTRGGQFPWTCSGGDVVKDSRPGGGLSRGAQRAARRLRPGAPDEGGQPRRMRAAR